MKEIDTVHAIQSALILENIVHTRKIGYVSNKKISLDIRIGRKFVSRYKSCKCKCKECQECHANG